MKPLQFVLEENATAGDSTKRIAVYYDNRKYIISIACAPTEEHNLDIEDLIQNEIAVLLDQVLRKIQTGGLAGEGVKYLESHLSEHEHPVIENREFVAVASLDKINFLKMSDIVYCKADGRYTLFSMKDGKQYMSSKNLGEYEHKLLDNNNFFRIHHAYIINMKFIKNIIKTDGNYCELENGIRLPISKRKIEGFYKFIGLKK